MKFAIEIGETEKHRLEYHFNQLFGSLLIKINERPVKQSVRLVNEPVLEVHVFVVGKYEHSEIRIEKEGPLVYLCTGTSCQPPTRDSQQLKTLLK